MLCMIGPSTANLQGLSIMADQCPLGVYLHPGGQEGKRKDLGSEDPTEGQRVREERGSRR